MKILWEIWRQGYPAKPGHVYRHGKVFALSFQSACDKLLGHSKLYDRDNLTFVGCKLFDSAAEAKNWRRHFEGIFDLLEMSDEEFYRYKREARERYEQWFHDLCQGIWDEYFADLFITKGADDGDRD